MPETTAIVLKKNARFNDKQFKDFLEFKCNPRKLCRCPCHRMAFLRSPAIHKAQEALSILQCLECSCKPFYINAEELVWFHFQVRIKFKKKYPLQWYNGKTPKWYKDDILFLYRLKMFLHAKDKK